jgi:hypothetical protein
MTEVVPGQAKNEWDITGHAERIAWRKAGRIPGWEVFKWERVSMETFDLIMDGGIPRPIKKGKNHIPPDLVVNL